MKAVLISINPQWCELIALGIKTVEVRKTKPKLETPFKVYIYCSQKDYDKIFCINKFMHKVFLYGNAKQKVIGEFVCDKIINISNKDLTENYRRLINIITTSCLEVRELKDYLGYKDGYGWHISNLVLYDKPRELSEFIVHEKTKCPAYLNGICLSTEQNSVVCCENLECKRKNLTRPPQSWCYVEV